MSHSKSETSFNSKSHPIHNGAVNSGFDYETEQNPDGPTHIRTLEYQKTPVPMELDDDYPEHYDEEPKGIMKYVFKVQNTLDKLVKKYSLFIKIIIIGILVILYHVWLGLALATNFQRAEFMLIATVIVWVGCIYYLLLKPKFGKTVNKNVIFPIKEMFNVISDIVYVKIGFYLLLIAAIVAFLIIDTKNDRSRLLGLCGIAFFILFMFVFSKAPSRINWRPVIWGFFMQFVLGFLVLRWEWGADKFEKFSHYLIVFLEYTNHGTSFVYGFLVNPPNICGMNQAVFAFSNLQVVVFFGSIVGVLYYYGIVQVVLKWMAWFMQITMGTTATESLNACACVFFGISESPLLIKPYMEKMTASELHAVMTAGFACIAGSLFATYIAFGTCPVYLLSATIMSAPASLACSKILFPETKKSKLLKIEDLDLPKGQESNALECISNGAVMAVELVVAIVANLIVFLAILAFINSIISFVGSMIGHEGWNFEMIVGYIFFPLAYIMGVTASPAETQRVAELMGIKTVLNEFISYQKLGEMVEEGKLSPRSSMIATYALCGFSNFSSIGIQLGILGGIAPGKKPLLSKIAFRALLAGSIACFITACLAGILVETPFNCPRISSNSNCFNITLYQQVLKGLTESTTTVSPNSMTNLLPSQHTEL